MKVLLFVNMFGVKIYANTTRKRRQMSVIAERIKQRRKELRLTQEVLAGLAGVDQTQISKYELGRNEPGSSELAMIASALSTTADWLLGLTDIPDRPLRGQADLSEDEREVIRIYRSKPLDKRPIALNVLKAV